MEIKMKYRSIFCIFSNYDEFSNAFVEHFVRRMLSLVVVKYIDYI